MKETLTLPHDSSAELVEEDLIRKRRAFWLRTIWFSLAGVLLPPLVGLAGTVAHMYNAFGQLSKTGTADPAALANNISLSLLGAAAGVIIALISLVIFLVALVRYFSIPKLGAQR